MLTADKVYRLGAVITHNDIGCRIDKMNSVLVGYAFQFAETPYAKFYTYENRTWPFASWSFMTLYQPSIYFKLLISIS
jgi:hypothetical protein